MTDLFSLLKKGFSCVCGNGRCDMLTLVYGEEGGTIKIIMSSGSFDKGFVVVNIWGEVGVFDLEKNGDFILESDGAPGLSEDDIKFLSELVSGFDLCSPDLPRLVDVGVDMLGFAEKVIRVFVNARIGWGISAKVNGCSVEVGYWFDTEYYETRCEGDGINFNVKAMQGRYEFFGNVSFVRSVDDTVVAEVNVESDGSVLISSEVKDLSGSYSVIREYVDGVVGIIKEATSGIMRYVALAGLFP